MHNYPSLKEEGIQSALILNKKEGLFFSKDDSNCTRRGKF
jgi:hypothetical protein